MYRAACVLGAVGLGECFLRRAWIGSWEQSSSAGEGVWAEDGLKQVMWAAWRRVRFPQGTCVMLAGPLPPMAHCIMVTVAYADRPKPGWALRVTKCFPGLRLGQCVWE